MTEIEHLGVGETTDAFINDLRELLAQAFGGRFSEDDWEHALGGAHIAVRDSGILVSHAAVVPRLLYVGDVVYSCGYVEAVATLPKMQRRGFASLAMREVNKLIESKYAIGALSSSTKDYYRKFGWEDWQGPSYIRTPDEWIRSESEDNGIMILNFEPHSDLDLYARIACDVRSGDSW